MKKKFRITFLAVILVFVMAACSDNQSSSRADQKREETNEQIVLRFATWDSGEALKIQETIAKKFEEKHPFIKVQMEAYGDEFDQKLTAAFGAKNPPDVMYMWNYPAYFQSLEPLENFIKIDPNIDLNDFYQGLFNYSTMYRKLYGMPAGFTTRVVYYNKDLFDAAGLTYPKDGWTWDEFKSMAKKLSNPATRQYGFGVRPEPDTYDLQGIVWSNGSSFISEDGKKVDSYMNSPETIETIELFADMVKEKSAVLVSGKNQQSGEEVFKAGKIAMWESGIWPLEEFKKAKINFGTVEMPAFKGKPVRGIISSSAISIAKDSKNKDLAWEFVKFFSSPEAIKMRTADLPVRISMVKELKTDQDPLIGPFYKMLERANDTPAYLLTKNWDEINRNLSSAINAIMLEQDAKELLNNAVIDSEKYMGQ
ncbi:multiple sugar transport system substrate-binding protein [Neobacillus niacini]|uniref:ABC transporter substrate-binding protein n=1 Tax=Neobacillus niacini TaxID=86668 RepID=UPI0028562753|nr:sugar ABC transporter substrate-binding protein [Neobacillus niacini]MDR7078947.1 multiple sugar transport system substrate-binding protein [Neobacillus niacini]